MAINHLSHSAQISVKLCVNLRETFLFLQSFADYNLQSYAEFNKFAAFNQAIMTLNERIESFSELGRILRNSLEGADTRYSSDLEKLINDQQYKNQWLTPENVRMAIKAIADELTHENLINWTNRYPSLDSVDSAINVGVIMAGNIPLVGFHDFLSVLISGNNLIAKTSSKDPELIVYISNMLCNINPGFKKKITFTDGLIKGFDAVIATGNDNSSRYFEYYFGKYPHIIRRNRNSVAIIEGFETEAELSKLGSDIFSYFGLGCRSVSKIYLPSGYDITEMTHNWSRYSTIINHNKYANNYDYNKAVFLVNKEKFIDTGYLLLKENKGIASPVSVLYFDLYNSINEVFQEVEDSREKIQCIVNRRNIPFGMAQSPRLWDYADGTDTIDFLLKKK